MLIVRSTCHFVYVSLRAKTEAGALSSDFLVWHSDIIEGNIMRCATHISTKNTKIINKRENARNASLFIQTDPRGEALNSVLISVTREWDWRLLIGREIYHKLWHRFNLTAKNETGKRCLVYASPLLHNNTAPCAAEDRNKQCKHSCSKTLRNFIIPPHGSLRLHNQRHGPEIKVLYTQRAT